MEHTYIKKHVYGLNPGSHKCFRLRWTVSPVHCACIRYNTRYTHPRAHHKNNNHNNVRHRTVPVYERTYRYSYICDARVILRKTAIMEHFMPCILLHFCVQSHELWRAGKVVDSAKYCTQFGQKRKWQTTGKSQDEGGVVQMCVRVNTIKLFDRNMCHVRNSRLRRVPLTVML